MRIHFYLFIVLLSSLVVSCASPRNDPPVAEPLDTTEVERQIDAAFGTVERNEKGVIVDVDLARERASANDEVLRAALSLPNLKRFRFAGGSVAAESLAGLKTQRELEELYLQDVPIRDGDWKPLLACLPKLTRLTLRRLANLSADELGALPQRLPTLRNLSLIEMEITGESLAEIAKSEFLTSLDVRNCGRLAAEDYRSLASLKKLTDLKIGGFAVNDEVLAVIAPLPSLRGLTIDDALLTPDGFEKFVTESLSADKLETLILGRNMSLFDAALVPLTRLPKLKRLTINGMMVTGSFLDNLAENETTRPKLQRLSLRKAFLTEEGAAALKKYSELRSLDLSGVALTPELVDIIGSLDWLEELDLTGCQLGEDLLQRLQTVKRLIR